MSCDLTTRYLGLNLKNPLVVSACPLTGKLETLKQIQAAGAAAVVLPSLFEEQLVHDELAIHHMHESHLESSAESLDYFPEMDTYNTGPDSYLDLVRQAKSELEIPVIASLNGSGPGGWIEYAQRLADAGADALELNIYIVPTEVELTGLQVESQYLEMVSAVRRTVSLPLAIKTGPYFSALPHWAARLRQAGADGLVLFNRYLEPDIDLESLEVVPHLVLSTTEELRLPLRWIAILRGRVELSLAATSGLHESGDLVKVLLAGADVGMMASALLQRGVSHIQTVLEELQRWLDAHEYTSVEQLKGSLSQLNSPQPNNYIRANYMKALVSYSD